MKIGGKLPVNFTLGAYYNALGPEYGATWQLRTQVTFIFRRRRLFNRQHPQCGIFARGEGPESTLCGRLREGAFCGASAPSQCEAHAVRSARSISVPKAMQATYDAVVVLTDAFCRDHLNDEYRDLARAMTAALCRKRPSPLASGQPRTWACGIIYVLGQLNFLSDKASQPYMTMAEVCAAFSVGQSTASAKARAISDALHTNRMDPTWMLREHR